LAAEGYEPYREDDGLALANCPFHALAEEQRELVCSMNLELVTGLLEGMSAPRVEACLDPGAARCCVRVRRAT
jgi:predicted ArsR family transcriptional regulator